MNSKEKALHAAITGTERFAGFDSFDSAEGDSYFDDSENFDGDGMSYFDGDAMSYAGGGGHASHAMSDPYVIQYTNTLTTDAAAVIFGYNDYSLVANFGNATGITVTNLQGGTYARLLTQSNNKPFKIGKFRFQCSTASQLQVTLSIVHVDANGKQYSSPVNLSVMKDSFQQQADIIDLTKSVTIDGNSSILFTLKASAVLTVSMYPVSIISSKARLNGGNAINNAKAPRLSGKNSTPVIIQTNQGVKGISGQ